ncbi:MAG: hypothetical protein Ta2B_16060 [Termitinemataceae bacterium]|nr:MAG: hypothetical protein Ta2B_16060 [Termitinemataceae bacterium]
MLRKGISILVLAVVIAGGVTAQTETEKLNKPGGFRAGLVLGPNFGERNPDLDPISYRGFGFNAFAELKFFKLDIGMNFEKPDNQDATWNYFIIGFMPKIPIAVGNRLIITLAGSYEYQFLLGDSDGNSRDDYEKLFDDLNKVDNARLKLGVMVDYAISKPLFVRAEIFYVYSAAHMDATDDGSGADIKLGVGYKF